MTLLIHGLLTLTSLVSTFPIEKQCTSEDVLQVRNCLYKTNAAHLDVESETVEQMRNRTIAKCYDNQKCFGNFKQCSRLFGILGYEETCDVMRFMNTPEWMECQEKMKEKENRSICIESFTDAQKTRSLHKTFTSTSSEYSCIINYIETNCSPVNIDQFKKALENTIYLETMRQNEGSKKR